MMAQPACRRAATAKVSVDAHLSSADPSSVIWSPAYPGQVGANFRGVQGGVAARPSAAEPDELRIPPAPIRGSYSGLVGRSEGAGHERKTMQHNQALSRSLAWLTRSPVGAKWVR